MDPERETIWTERCDCGSGHFVSVIKWDGDDDVLWIEFYEQQDSFWERIRAAVDILVGRPVTHTEVTIGREKRHRLAQALLSSAGAE